MNQNSKQRNVWKSVRKNKPALVALWFIISLLFIAIFSYVLAPDKNKDANTVCLEIATRSPGFSCYLIKVPYEQKVEQAFLSKIFTGKLADGEYIPASSFQLLDSTLSVQHIISEEQEELMMLPLVKWKQFNIKEHIIKRTFYLGTDKYGRDVLSRLLIGTRISLAVGFIAVIISLFIGVILGSISAYYGGVIDGVITWFINVIWAIPTLLLVFSVTAVLGKSFWLIFIAIGCTMWVGTARLIRGQVISLKESEYIQVAKTMGFHSLYVIRKHILPNILGPTIVLSAGNFATAILIEAGMSFLGVGVQPPVSSWGLMIKENYHFLITNRPLLALIPGFAIMLSVLAFNILGNALRDALDVRSIN